ncbi:MAG TPA: hypothetical protein VLG76_06355 [Rhabdochlamydiaceae bacterium]|nr:hypothetical protein [Rhabdochlamydiaceae bacterium]
MVTRVLARASESLNIAIREAVTSAKSALHKRVWQIPETSTKLFQRVLSHEQLPKMGSNIPKLFSAVLGGGVLMTQQIKLEDASIENLTTGSILTPSGCEELAKSAVKVIGKSLRHLMPNTPLEVENAIVNYLKERIHLALTDPSTFALGCEIEVAPVNVRPYLSHKELAFHIPPTFTVILPAQTLTLLMNNEFSTLDVIVREKNVDFVTVVF